MSDVALGAAGGLLVLLIWFGLHRLEPVGPTRIPAPGSTLEALAQLSREGLLLDILASLGRTLGGFSLATVLGCGAALLLGVSATARKIFAPTLGFLRYIPPSAFVALLVVYFGIGLGYQIAVIVAGVALFNFKMTLDVVDDVDQRFVEMFLMERPEPQGLIGNLRLKLDQLKQVYLPSTSPRIWDILRINISFAWTFTVIAEAVATERGLGRVLLLKQRNLDIEAMYACLIVFAIIGLITDWTMAVMSKVIFPWHHQAVGDDRRD